MASPEELPDIPLFQEEYFDPDVVAEEVIWPVVDRLARRNWREEAFPGNKFEFPGRRVVGGEAIDVNLMASCQLLGDDEVSSNGDQVEQFATLEIKRPVPTVFRDFLLAKYEEAPASLRSVSEHNLEAKKVMLYFFSTNSDFDADAFSQLQNLGGDMVWHLEEQSHPEQSEEDARLESAEADALLDYVQLREYDLTDIALAIRILTGSRRYQASIDAIKTRPITAIE